MHENELSGPPIMPQQGLEPRTFATVCQRVKLTTVIIKKTEIAKCQIFQYKIFTSACHSRTAKYL